MRFTGTTGDHVRFELLGTTQTLAGLDNVGTGGVVPTGTGRGVVQVSEQVKAPVVSALSTLILDIPSGATYTYNGYFRSTGGTLALVKNGLGKQVFSGAEIDHTGGTTINAGIIECSTGNVTDQQTGPLVINAGGTMQSVAATNLNGPVNMNGGTLAGIGAVSASYGHFVLGNTLTVGGTQTSVISADVRVGSNADRTFNVGVTGDPSGIDLDITGKIGHTNNVNWGYMTKTGAGTLRFNNPALNSDIGRITVNAGKVLFKDYMAGMGNGGLITNALAETNLGSGVNYTFGQAIAGNAAGTFTKSGPGTLTLSSNNSSSAGKWVVAGGKLTGTAAGTGSNSVFGLRNSGRTITVNTGGVLEFQAANTFGGHNATGTPALVINGGTVTNAGSAGNNALGEVQLNNGTLTSTTGSASVIGDNGRTDTYGAWNINGTVTSSGASSISTTAASNGHVMLASAGVGPWNTTFNVLDGTLAVSTGLIDGNHGAVIPSGLIKTGAGTMTVGGTNTYSGPTAVNVGTLSLTGSVQKTSGATVAAGATLDLARAGSASALDVVTPVTNDGLLSVSTAGQQVRAVSGIGTTNVAGGAGLTANSIVQNTLIIGAGGSVTIRDVPTAAGGAANAVPEPGTWVLIGTALVGWLAFRRRRGC
jgi:autotransporter-associated beta strand protein